ncbi:MAG TPA: hypothetical protein VE861_13535 [Gemmatimonadaceae bacterium]|nr:hypothetical protein [Gemmatimonadaceae bacterium]
MPDNTGFMIAGYAATVIVLVGYVVSLVVRARAMARRGAAIDSVPRS